MSAPHARAALLVVFAGTILIGLNATMLSVAWPTVTGDHRGEAWRGTLMLALPRHRRPDAEASADYYARRIEQLGATELNALLLVLRTAVCALLGLTATGQQAVRGLRPVELPWNESNRFCEGALVQ